MSTEPGTEPIQSVSQHTFDPMSNTHVIASSEPGSHNAEIDLQGHQYGDDDNDDSFTESITVDPVGKIDNDLEDDSEPDYVYDSISDSTPMQTPSHMSASATPSHSEHATADGSIANQTSGGNGTVRQASISDEHATRRPRVTIHVGDSSHHSTVATADGPSFHSSQDDEQTAAPRTTQPVNQKQVVVADAVVIKNQIKSKQDLESRQILVTKQPTNEWGSFQVDKFGRILNQESAANARIIRAGTPNNRSGPDVKDEVSRTMTTNDSVPDRESTTTISTSRQSSIHVSDMKKLKEDGKKHKRDVERESKWVDMLSHWDEYCSPKREHILKRRIRKGIPSSARASVWPLLMRINETKSKYPPNYYQTLVHGSILEQHDIQIRKDLPRLMQDHIMFKSPIAGSRTVLCHGQAMLYNVLKAYSIYDPDVGYVQGMDTVAAPALMYFTEEQTFWYLERLLNGKKYGLRYNYIDGFPLAHQYVWIHERLVQRYLPKLHRIMTDNCIQHSGYAFRWYTMRYGQFAPELSFRILDIYLYEGDKILYRVALALLKQRMNLLLSDPDSILENLMKIENEYEAHSANGGDSVIEMALRIPLTTEEIHQLEDQYEQSMNIDMKRLRNRS